jgi:hypothetical protein
MTKIPEEKIPENDLKRKIMKIRAKMPDPSPRPDGLNRYPKT